MKSFSLPLLLLCMVLILSCTKEDQAEEPHISELTTGTWRITEIQASNDFPFLRSATAMEGTVMGSVNFTTDSMYHAFLGTAMVSDSLGSTPSFLTLADTLFGTFSIINEEEFVVHEPVQQIAIYCDGLSRSSDSWYMRYSHRSEFPITTDSTLQINETFILKLER